MFAQKEDRPAKSAWIPSRELALRFKAYLQSTLIGGSGEANRKRLLSSKGVLLILATTRALVRWAIQDGLLPPSAAAAFMQAGRDRTPHHALSNVPLTVTSPSGCCEPSRPKAYALASCELTIPLLRGFNRDKATLYPPFSPSVHAMLRRCLAAQITRRADEIGVVPGVQLSNGALDDEPGSMFRGALQRMAARRETGVQGEMKMHADVYPPSGNPALPDGTIQRVCWYIPKRQIRTRTAARRAVELAEWSASSRQLDMQPEDQALFIALHTCAFHAERCATDQPASSAGRDAWVRRWSTIRECLVRRHMGLVYAMVHRFRPSDGDEEDRVSDALFGLVRAVDRFNPWKGYRFSTYACNTILRALIRFGSRESRYRVLFPIQCDAGLQHACPQPDPIAGLWAERLQQIIHGNLAGLTDIEAKVLRHRFPPRDEPHLSFEEIGRAVGLSKERVRQIQNALLKRLRRILETDPILR